MPDGQEAQPEATPNVQRPMEGGRAKLTAVLSFKSSAFAATARQVSFKRTRRKEVSKSEFIVSQLPDF
jgi:hypothetical protein